VNRYHLLGLITLLLIGSPAFTDSFAISNDEWLDIDMQFVQSGENLTITCSKDSNVTYNMLMTVINYDAKEFIIAIDSSFNVIYQTISLVDDSMIQVFCEYTNNNGDKVGYAIMRIFTNA